MPASIPSFLPGNFVNLPDYTVGERADMIIPGFATEVWEGFARVTTTTGNAIALANRADQACIINASATDPAWVYHASFFIPSYTSANPNEYGSNTVTVSGTEVLKFAPLAATDLSVATTVGAVTAAATAGVVPSGEAISIITPNAPVQLTAQTTLQLYSNSVAGAGVAGGNIRVTSGWFWIPCQVMWCKRMRAPSLSDPNFSDAQLRINANA